MYKRIPLLLCLLSLGGYLQERTTTAAVPTITVVTKATEFLLGEMQKRNEQQRLAEIGQQLAEINAKLDVISEQLKQALEALQKLQERLEDIQDEQARKHVLGTSAQIHVFSQGTKLGEEILEGTNPSP